MNAIEEWSARLGVTQVRIARPTDKLSEVIRFYTEGLGLTKLGGFEGHDGYDGVFIGLPGASYHLEFTARAAGSPCPAPSEDNLLVLYIPNPTLIERIAQRLEAMGYPPVPPENPFWLDRGVTIADPDGWRVVLMNARGIGG